METAWRNGTLGQTFDEEQEIITFGELTDAPNDVKLGDPENMLLTVPVLVENTDTIQLLYKARFHKLMDEAGNHYKAKHMEIVEERNWKFQSSLEGGGLAHVLLTYEVPKNVNQLVMIFKVSDLPGDMIIEIPMEKSTVVNGESNQDKETVIDELLKTAHETGRPGDTFGSGTTLTVGELTDPPNDVNLENNKNRLLTIPVKMEHFDQRASGGINYMPQYQNIVVDAEGNEYKPLNMTVIENKDWAEKKFLKAGGIADVLLTYEIPRDIQRVAFVIETDSFPRGIIIDVQIPSN